MNSDAEYQEKVIKSLISKVNQTWDEIIDNDMYDGEDSDIQSNRLIEELSGLGDALYTVCLAYIDAKNIPNYLDYFKEKVKPYNESFSSVKEEYEDPYGGLHCGLRVAYESLLEPFPAFAPSVQKEGISYLESILENTASIIKERRVIPDSEASIYNAVKFVCKAVFNDHKLPSEAFIKTAKAYKPDILLPSLKCAVEYKYAPTLDNLIRTIDEILIDVKGYNANLSYKFFYAVFYTKPGICSKSRFDEIWKEKGFPENWKAIYVVGD